MQLANRNSKDQEETHIGVSDEWIVQFGGVLVELEKIKKRKELVNTSPQSD